jgi:glucose-6-phosphate isomerase
LIKYNPTKTATLAPSEENLHAVWDYIDKINELSANSDFEVEDDYIFLPSIKNERQNLNTYLKKVAGLNFDFIIFVGIGGANLGVETVYTTFNPEKEIIFFDNIDPDDNQEKFSKIEAYYRDGKSAVFVTASKSGATTETMANFASVLALFKKVEPDYLNRTFVTTVEDSILDGIAKSNKLQVINVHENLVDRYSVFGLSSLFGASLAGIDTEQLLKGAEDITKQLLTKDIENPALNIAVTLYNAGKKNFDIYNHFIFSSKLNCFGRWYRQLKAESLGKEGKGMLPIFSVGTVDLHSMTQLYLDGPKNIFTTFITLENFENNAVCDPDGLLENSKMDKISKKNTSELMSIVVNAVKKAYEKQKLPYNEIILPKLNEYYLGQLMQLSMLSVSFLGILMEVNPYNQDAVEIYKEEIRNLL